VQQAHLLLVEEVALPRVQKQDAGGLARREQRQRDERARLRIVPDDRARAEPQASEVAIGAALARCSDLAHDVRERIGESDGGKAKATLLHRDAAGLVEERLPVARAHDERIHRREHFEGAVQPLDAPLLRFERAGLFQQLVDDDAQMAFAEIARDLRRLLGARGQHRLDLAQNLRVLRGFEQHARDAVRLCERLRVPAAEVRRIEDDRHARGGRIGLQAPRELVAVHRRHEHIRDHEVGSCLLRALETFAPVHRARHAMTRSLEERSKRLAVRAVVVGDEDGGHRGVDNHGATACPRLPHDANYFVVISRDLLSQMRDSCH
jgi:hypothetical protein